MVACTLCLGGIRLRPQCHVLPVLPASLKDDDTTAVTYQSVVASKTRYDLIWVNLWWHNVVVAAERCGIKDYTRNVQSVVVSKTIQQSGMASVYPVMSQSLVALMLCACWMWWHQRPYTVMYSPLWWHSLKTNPMYSLWWLQRLCSMYRWWWSVI